MKTQTVIASLILLGSISAFAGPVTTTPWNGHTGAVSFTYDDARDGQIPNLIPQLDSLNIKATFEIAAANVGTFNTRKSAWLQVARNGHELANHTYTHTSLTDANAAGLIKDMADTLRRLDTTIQSVTFAYPNCVVPGTTGKNGVNAENFIARGCGGTTYAWGTQPSDWMNIQGLIVTNNVTTSATSELSSAKTNNTWASIIIHDVVNPPPDIYSMTPANNRIILNAGVSNLLWIDTYLNVAAYYRAHFTMDTATAKTVSGGWNLAWVSPHPKMPKSVKLRVKFATATFGTSFTVQQGGVTIPVETDGSYIIDFMRLSLQVLQGSTGIKSRVILPPKLDARMTRNGIAFGGVFGEVEATVVDVRGNRVFHGRVPNRMVPLRNDQMRGILFLTLSDRTSKASVRAVVTAIR